MPQSYDRPKLSLYTESNYMKMSDGSWVSSGNYQTFLTSGQDSRSFSGNRVSGWKTLRKTQGWLPTTAASDDIVHTVGNTSVQTVGGDSTGMKTVSSATVDCGLPFDVGFPSRIVDQAYYRMAEKVAQNDWMAALTLVEARQTTTFIAKIASNTYESLKEFKRGNLPGALKKIGITADRRELSNDFLAYRFGIQATLQDVKAAAEFAARRTLNQSHAILVMGTSRETERVDEVYTNVSNWQRQQRSKVQRDYIAKSWVRVRVDNPTLRAAAEAGLTNPLAFAWEATPYSFVYDYFSDVGNYLSSLTAFQGLTTLDAGYSWRRTDSGVMYQGLGPAPRDGERSSSYHRVKYRRYPSKWSPSLLRAIAPKFELPSLVQLATITALIGKMRS